MDHILSEAIQETYHTAPLRESSPMLIPGLGILVVLTGAFLVLITI